VNYGRDADSIATMSGAITGALGGIAVVPADWHERIASASRLDLAAVGRTMADVAREIHELDRARFAARDAAINGIADAAGPVGVGPDPVTVDVEVALEGGAVAR